MNYERDSPDPGEIKEIMLDMRAGLRQDPRTQLRG